MESLVSISTIDEAKVKTGFITFLAILYIVLAIISAPIFQLGGFGIRPDDIVLGFLFCVILINISIDHSSGNLLPRNLLLAFFLLILLSTFSLFYNSVFRNLTGSIGDLSHEISRFAKYFFILQAFWYLGNNEIGEERIVKYLFFASIVSVFVAYAQLFNLFGINKFFYTNYSPKYEFFMPLTDQAGILGIKRIISTFYNPNIFAVFLAIPISICISKVLIDIERRLFYILLAAFFFSGIQISQSRTGLLISLLLIPVSWVIVRRREKGLSTTRTVLLVVLIICFVIVFSTSSSYFGLERIGSFGYSEGSVQLRLDTLRTISKEVFITSPIFGLSAAQPPPYALDNEYLYFFYFYGLLGLFAYVFFLVVLYKLIPKTTDPLIIALSSVLLVYLIANFSLGTFFSEKVYVVFLALYGLVVSRRRRPLISE